MAAANCFAQRGWTYSCGPRPASCPEDVSQQHKHAAHSAAFPNNFKMDTLPAAGLTASNTPDLFGWSPNVKQAVKAKTCILVAP